MSIYVGDGLKFEQKVKPFPMHPPSFDLDEEEYEEFVLPTVDEKDMDPLTAALVGAVEEIWDQFDTDGSGTLEQEEAEKFFQEMLSQIMANEKTSSLDKDTLQSAFEAIDKDGNGRITKNEMIAFARGVAEGKQ